MKHASYVVALVLLVCVGALHADTVKVGLNYPKTGPYSVMGLDQWQATEMAVEEINAAGGILGKQIEIVWRDSQSKKDVSIKNATEMIEKDQVKMIFGGSASSVAVAVGSVCHEKGIPFFGTLTYSTATTGVEGKRHVFRVI